MKIKLIYLIMLISTISFKTQETRDYDSDYQNFIIKCRTELENKGSVKVSQDDRTNKHYYLRYHDRSKNEILLTILKNPHISKDKFGNEQVKTDSSTASIMIIDCNNDTWEILSHIDYDENMNVVFNAEIPRNKTRKEDIKQDSVIGTCRNIICK